MFKCSLIGKNKLIYIFVYNQSLQFTHDISFSSQVFFRQYYSLTIDETIVESCIQNIA